MPSSDRWISLRNDAAYEEAMYEEWEKERRQEIIEDFVFERLLSFYLDKPFLAAPAFAALKEATSLIDDHPSAALVFALTSVEVGIRDVLIKPVIVGLVHSESMASLIADAAVRSESSRFRDLLFSILSEHAGVDLHEFRRVDSKRPLWEEIRELQQLRNKIVHQGESGDLDEAKRALAVAGAILEHLFPAILGKLGMHLHDGVEICRRHHFERLIDLPESSG